MQCLKFLRFGFWDIRADLKSVGSLVSIANPDQRS
jgi:hypothetical protein